MKLARRILAWCCYQSGVTTGLYRLFIRNTPHVGLVVHRIYGRKEELGNIPMGEIRVDRLEEHLRWIARECQICSLDDWLKDLDDGGTAGKPKVFVSFDDAYRDFVRYAAPICSKLGIRPILFVPTDFLDHPEQIPWWDVPYRADPPGGIRRGDPRLDELVGEMSRAANVDPAHAVAVVKETGRRQGWRLREEGQPNEFCRWEDLRALAGQVDFGAHGCDHVPMHRISVKEARIQMEQSAARIRAETGVMPRVLAYPSGAWSVVGTALAKEAEASGFDAAFCMDGPFGSQSKGRWRLPRYVLPPRPTWSFSAHWLQAALLSRRRTDDKEDEP